MTDLHLVAETLSKPPFSKPYSAIQLHSDVPHPTLLQLITDVAASLDDPCPTPPSIHKVDIRNEDPELTAWRISDLLRILKYKADM
jgi:intraflagellar transport protein 81